VLAHTAGFIYYVSIAGITGTKSAAADTVAAAVKRLKRHSALPVAVGFGVRTPEQAAAIARIADAAVIGSALVERVAANLDGAGKPKPGLVAAVLDQVRLLSQGVRAARQVTTRANAT
jgi:tryptophan synthase alpha chain